jgi:hypothetical protein
MGRAEGRLHCVASQQVQSLEIFSLMSRESPPLTGLLLLGRSLWLPNLISLRPTVPKISAHLGHYGRFLEKRPGDLVRPHCVTDVSLHQVDTKEAHLIEQRFPNSVAAIPAALEFGR